MKAGSGPPRWRVLLLLRCVPLLLAACLAACTMGPVSLFGSSPSVQTLALAAVLPLSGPDAQLGQAMEHGVELAVRQNAAPAKSVRLTVRSVDEAAATGQSMSALAADTTVMGIVGPLESETASTLVPLVERQQLATISPGAALASLNLPNPAEPDGVDYPSLHLKGTGLAFFQLDTLDAAAAKAAALAVAPTAHGGLGAHSILVVTDGSSSGQEQAAAFSSALSNAGGASAGTATVTLGTADDAEAAVVDIVRADPDAVFYAGGTQGGADLRRALTLSGAPQMVLLSTAPIADNPGWSADVGQAAASAYTTALLPVPAAMTSPAATAFTTAYHSTFGVSPLPQAAMAYDATMDEIASIKALLAAGKPVTRAAVLSHVALTPYSGVTGTLAFDANGAPRTPLGFGVYSCDATGTWKLVGSAPS